jgi:hypothetical protein
MGKNDHLNQEVKINLGKQSISKEDQGLGILT